MRTKNPTTPQATAAPAGTVPIHPVWLRITHWLNAVAILVMVASGWRIYNASPIFDFSFPAAITLGGWLGGAIQWHFAAMWLVAVNGLAYLAMNLVTGRLGRKFFPLSPGQIGKDFWAAMRGHLSHADLRKYNAVQKLSYLFVMADTLLLVLSGMVLWKSVQFGFLRELLGGYELARRLHFFAMASLVAFIVVHLVMVALVPRTFITMFKARPFGEKA